MSKKRQKLILKTELFLIIIGIGTLFVMAYFNTKNLSNISALVNLGGCLIMVDLVINFYKKADKLIDKEKEELNKILN